MCAKPATASPVWDPLVRLCHWLTVALVLANYLWLEDEQHEWAGYLLALTLAVRLLWGLVGSANTPALPASGRHPPGCAFICVNSCRRRYAASRRPMPTPATTPWGR